MRLEARLLAMKGKTMRPVSAVFCSGSDVHLSWSHGSRGSESITTPSSAGCSISTRPVLLSSSSQHATTGTKMAKWSETNSRALPSSSDGSTGAVTAQSPPRSFRRALKGTVANSKDMEGWFPRVSKSIVTLNMPMPMGNPCGSICTCPKNPKPSHRSWSGFMAVVGPKETSPGSTQSSFD